MSTFLFPGTEKRFGHKKTAYRCLSCVKLVLLSLLRLQTYENSCVLLMQSYGFQTIHERKVESRSYHVMPWRWEVIKHINVINKVDLLNYITDSLSAYINIICQYLQIRGNSSSGRDKNISSQNWFLVPTFINQIKLNSLSL